MLYVRGLDGRFGRWVGEDGFDSELMCLLIIENIEIVEGCRREWDWSLQCWVNLNHSVSMKMYSQNVEI